MAKALSAYFNYTAPLIASISVKRRGDVRRAKLYYLRELSGRAARIKEKLTRKKPAEAKKEKAPKAAVVEAVPTETASD